MVNTENLYFMKNKVKNLDLSFLYNCDIGDNGNCESKNVKKISRNNSLNLSHLKTSININSNKTKVNKIINVKGVKPNMVNYNSESQLMRYQKFIMRNKIINGIDKMDNQNKPNNPNLNNSKINKVNTNNTQHTNSNKAKDFSYSYSRNKLNLNLNKNESLTNKTQEESMIILPNKNNLSVLVKNEKKLKLQSLIDIGNIIKNKNKSIRKLNYVSNNNSIAGISGAGPNIPFKVKNIKNFKVGYGIQNNFAIKNVMPIKKIIRKDSKSNTSHIDLNTNVRNFPLIKTKKEVRREIFNHETENSFVSNNSIERENDSVFFEKTGNFSFFNERDKNLDISNINHSHNNFQLEEFSNLKIKDEGYYKNDHEVFDNYNNNSITYYTNNKELNKSVDHLKNTIIGHKESGFTFRERKILEDLKNKNKKNNLYLIEDKTLKNLQIAIKAKVLIKNTDLLNAKTKFPNKKYIGPLNNYKNKEVEERKLFMFSNKVIEGGSPIPLKPNTKFVKDLSKVEDRKINNFLNSFKNQNQPINPKFSFSDKESRQSTGCDSKPGNKTSSKKMFLLDINKSRLDTPQEKSAYTESNRLSLNDSIRKLYNGSPKIMKHHPGVKEFFDL